MRVALLGGAGLRAPLLARALARSGLGVRELALFDRDPARLARIAPLARGLAPGLRIRETTDAAAAVRGSRVVIAAIRVGGQEARARDERICLEAGVLGQETVGAAGAALAMRNVPAVLGLARIVEREAPEAILLNYTNPAGLVSEALLGETSLEVIGICDTPAEVAGRVARLLYLDPDRCLPGWSGVNHLGWLTALYHPVDKTPRMGIRPRRDAEPRRPGGCGALSPPDGDPNRWRDPVRRLSRGGRTLPGGASRRVGGRGTSSTACYGPEEGPFPPTDRLAELFRDPDRLLRVHPGPLFAEAELAGAVPSEYVFLHLHPERARDGARRAGTTRGSQVLALEARLFAELDATRGDPLAAYRAVMAARDGSYFGIEARGEAEPATAAEDAPSGYDRIGIQVLRARFGIEPRDIVVNARNRTRAGGPAVPELLPDDVVEVTARVGPDGVEPVPQRPLPRRAGALLRRVRAVEREILRSALTGDPRFAEAALAEHPAGGPRAAAVFRELGLPPVGRMRSGSVPVP